LHVTIAKGTWLRRKNLEYPHELLLLENGHDENRTNPEVPAGNRIDAQIGLGVIAALHLSRLHAGSAQSPCRIQANAQVRSSCPGRGPADDFVPAPEGDGGAGGVGGQAGLFGQTVEQEIERQVGGQKNFAVRRQGIGQNR
jgi:hypothetical protein